MMSKLTCAEGSRYRLKEHFADLYEHVLRVYADAASDVKDDVKKEIIAHANRVIILIEKEK